jgi:hypothetical protein
VRAGGETYPGQVLDLSSIDLEEIADALADQTDYEHHWLINPDTGEIAFWTVDTGIDGQTPVDLDELDLIVIGPLPSWIWYQDMADFADGITDERAGAGWHVRSRARDPSAGSKTSSTRSTRTCCRRGTPSGTPGPGAGPCNGWLITPSLTMAVRIASCPGTQIPPCPEPVDAVTGALSYPRFAWRASTGSIRWRCEGAQQRGQFAVGTDVLAVERAAGRGRQAYGKGQ